MTEVFNSITKQLESFEVRYFCSTLGLKIDAMCLFYDFLLYLPVLHYVS